jgi:hypothetical protein
MRARFGRGLLLILLTTATLVIIAGDASARILVRDPFNGTGPLSHRWQQRDAEWRRVHGAVKVKPDTVSMRTNVGYATTALGKPRKQLTVTAHLRLSPTRANVGIVAPFENVKNNLFCKVEDTPAHPDGYLAIGRRLHGSEPIIRKGDDGIGIRTARRYLMKVTRARRDVTCSLRKGSMLIASISYRLTKADVKAFGGGREAGIRIRLVSRGTRKDEDDGRSAFDSFMARTGSA